MSGHPIKEFENELNEMSIMNIKSYYEQFYSSGQSNKALENSTICGVIVNMRQQRIGPDKHMYIVTVDDSSGRIQVILYSDIYFEYRELITENKILFFTGKMSIDEFDSQLVMRVNKISSFEDTRKRFSKSIFKEFGSLEIPDKPFFSATARPVSYTHLTLPTNREV